MTRLSNKQLDELGERLRTSDPTAEDLELLGQVRSLYAGALDEVLRVLADLGLEPGGRLKTTGTLIDKLRRIPGMQLSRVQDVAGARVVAEATRAEQDSLVERITARFADHRVKDRRAEPSFGYRAVHVIVRVQGRLVEIQVRTHLQDRWAQIVERLADTWGRGIRYGEPPSGPDPLAGLGVVTRWEIVQDVMELAEEIDLVERGGLVAVPGLLSWEKPAPLPNPFEAELAKARAERERAERRLWDTVFRRVHDATEPDTLEP